MVPIPATIPALTLAASLTTTQTIAAAIMTVEMTPTPIATTITEDLIPAAAAVMGVVVEIREVVEVVEIEEAVRVVNFSGSPQSSIFPISSFTTARIVRLFRHEGTGSPVFSFASGSRHSS